MGRKLLAVVLLFCALRLFGATGDIVSISTDGWTAYVSISGLSTGGTFAYGYNANRTISGGEKLVFFVTRTGYNSLAQVTSRTKVIYGTKIVRVAGGTTLDEQVGGGNVTNRISLSDYIYPGETVTANVGVGFYTQGGNPNNAATGMSVANNSNLHYPMTIGNWTCVPFQMITNTLTLRCVAFHASARDGKPVACVVFTATDQHANTASVTNATWMIDRSQGDAVPFGEIVSSLNVSGFTQGDLITCNFKAYPWEGDSTAVLDTSATGFVQPTHFPAPLTNICDNAGTFGAVYAIVDASTGNDSTGAAANNTSWNGNQNPNPFLTIGGALKACAGTNAFYGAGHANVENCYVFLKAGLYAWMGSSPAAPAQANTNNWCHIMAYPGVATTSVILTNQAGSSRFISNQDRYHFKNVSMSGSAAGGLFIREHIWQDQCNCQWTGASYFQADTVINQWYVTQGVVSNLTQGILPTANQFAVPVLVRGVDLTDMNKKCMAYTFVGNVHRATDAGLAFQIVWDGSGQLSTNQWGVFYNNDIRGLANGGGGNVTALPSVAGIYTNGAVFVQNVLDTGTNRTATASVFDEIGTDAGSMTNLMNWHNDTLINRSLNYYNASGTTAFWRYLFSTYNNVWTDYNIKSDTYPSASANRVGNWPDVWGVAYWGNVDCACTNSAGNAANAFQNEDDTGTSNLGFDGFNCYDYYRDNGSHGSDTNWPAFVGQPYYAVGTDMRSQSTDYRLQSVSPLLLLPKAKWVLPFDIYGTPRGIDDPPGAVAIGNPRKGVFIGL